MKLTTAQIKALETLKYNGTVSATDFDRSAFEGLVRKNLAIKHHNGNFVNYSIKMMTVTN